MIKKEKKRKQNKTKEKEKEKKDLEPTSSLSSHSSPLETSAHRLRPGHLTCLSHLPLHVTQNFISDIFLLTIPVNSPHVTFYLAKNQNFVLGLYQHFVDYLTLGKFLSSHLNQNLLSFTVRVIHSQSSFAHWLTRTTVIDTPWLARLDCLNRRADRKHKHTHTQRWRRNKEVGKKRYEGKPGKICENSALQGSSSPP